MDCSLLKGDCFDQGKYNKDAKKNSFCSFCNNFFVFQYFDNAIDKFANYKCTSPFQNGKLSTAFQYKIGSKKGDDL